MKNWDCLVTWESDLIKYVYPAGTSLTAALTDIPEIALLYLVWLPIAVKVKHHEFQCRAVQSHPGPQVLAAVFADASLL